MFTALAGMYMAAKVNLMQAKANISKHNNQQVSQTLYHNKVDKLDEKEKYKKSKLPESGYMTVEEYEQKSRGLTRKEINESKCTYMFIAWFGCKPGKILPSTISK